MGCSLRYLTPWWQCRIYLNWDKRMYQHLSIVEFSDLLCMNIWERKERKADHIAVAATLHQQQSGGNQMQIECITDSEGNTERPNPSDYQREKEGRTKGSKYSANCFICHKYVPKEGATNYNMTTFCCRDCKMPLCKADRWSVHQKLTCYDEHKMSDDPDLGCNGVLNKNRQFPTNKQVVIQNAE